MVEYAKTRYKQINLIGFSLGAAISIIHTAKYKDINGLIAVTRGLLVLAKSKTDFIKKKRFYRQLKNLSCGEV
ncbi:MAG: hypothetical protein MZU79_02055 [Anaerotruncus sp.]|nr:hypothetical protein [Anaerotruncus sp.]